jgi:acyl-CoA synthetase (AMP-forming)/AMP-acid ligase II
MMRFNVLVVPYMLARGERVALAGSDPARFQQLTHRVRDQMQFAEQLGYSSFCMMEQHMQIEGIETTTNPLFWDLFVAQHTKTMRVGEIGELIVRSDVAFAGYWRAPEKDRETICDGWIHTGDMARPDDGGYVYLSDRAKFRIKTGGYNVFPTEVENVLPEHPAVNEVAVVGLPDCS